MRETIILSVIVSTFSVLSCSSDGNDSTDVRFTQDSSTNDAVTTQDSSPSESEDNGATTTNEGKITDNIVAILEHGLATYGMFLFDVMGNGFVSSVPGVFIDTGSSYKFVKYKAALWNKDRTNLVGIMCDDKKDMLFDNDETIVDFLDPHTGKILKSVTLSTGAACGTSSFTMAPDESKFYFTQNTAGPFEIELKDGAKPVEFADFNTSTISGYVGNIHISPDGTKFVVGTSKGIYILGTDGKVIANPLPLSGDIPAVRWVDNDTFVAFLVNKIIVKYTLSTGSKSEYDVGFTMYAQGITISPDGSKAIYSNKLFDFSTQTTKELSFDRSFSVIWNAL